MGEREREREQQKEDQKEEDVNERKKKETERENRGRSDCHVEGGITAEKGMREVKRGGEGGGN